MLTDEQIDIMKKNEALLRDLPDDKLIMLALAELIACTSEIPIGKRISLLSMLENRAGIKPFEMSEPS